MGGRGGGAPGNAGRSESGAPAASQSNAMTFERVQDIIRRERGVGQIMGLASFRDSLGGTREQQDALIMDLVRSRQIRLFPEENRKTLTARDRGASVNLSGEEKHLIAITSDMN